MTKIIQRHDTAANWTAVNPVLAAGEMGVETDTNKFKFGDGSTVWSGLAYADDRKQDKLTAAAPVKIYSGDIQVPNVEPSEPSAISSTNILTCSATSTAEFGYGINLGTASSWEYRIKFKFPGWDYGYQALLGTLADNPYDSPVLDFIQSNKTTVLYMSSDGSSWNIQPLKTSSPFVNGGIYYLSFGFTGSKYYIKYNQSGWNGTFTTLATKSSSIRIRSFSGKKTLGWLVQPFYGDIYLEESSLLINGETAWTGTILQEGGTYIGSSAATTSSLGVVQPDGTTITVNEAGVISGQDVKTFTGYSDTGTLVLKSINGVLQWVAE